MEPGGSKANSVLPLSKIFMTVNLLPLIVASDTARWLPMTDREDVVIIGGDERGKNGYGGGKTVNRR